MHGHTERDFETSIEAGLTGFGGYESGAQMHMTKRWPSSPPMSPIS